MAGEAGQSEPFGPRAYYLASQATMCVSVLVFFSECFAYNAIFLRRILPAVGKAHLAPLFRVLFNTVWALGLWSYHQAHWSDPGAVPDRWHRFVRTVGEALPIAPARPEWQPSKATLCKKCQAPRPERAHHCVLCGTCVLRMDHHCPWINNCVGFHNHKFFLLLGTYAWLASLIALSTAMPELIRLLAVVAGLQSIESFQSEGGFLHMWDVYASLLFGIFALLIGLLLTSLLSTHVPLAFRNMTTIEDFYENMPNPFEQGSRRGNLEQVFGRLGLDWFLPVQPWNPVADGVSYPPPQDLGAFGVGSCGSPRDAEALRLLEHAGPGGVPLQPGQLALAPALLHEQGADVERTWRLRYKVRAFDESQASKEEHVTPFLSQFWACGRGHERTAVSAAAARAAGLPTRRQNEG